MTKRQFVELIQDRLSGGDMPDDMKGKMHPRVIEEWLGLALIEILSDLEDKDSKSGHGFSAASLIQSYPVDVLEVNGRFTVDLPYKLLSGHDSFYGFFPCEDGMPLGLRRKGGENTALNYLKGDCAVTLYIEGNRLVFSGNPKVETGTVQMLPSMDSMKADDDLVVPKGVGRAIAEYTVNMMLGKLNQPEDELNNQTADNERQK